MSDFKILFDQDHVLHAQRWYRLHATVGKVSPYQDDVMHVPGHVVKFVDELYHVVSTAVKISVIQVNEKS